MALWYLMRGTGVVSLVLLTGVFALGVATRQRARIPTLPRFATLALHRSLSLLAVTFIAIHVLTALVDPYAAVAVVDLLVPFTASSQPLWIGLGALALDLVLALILTGMLRRRIGRRAFRLVHWSAYAAWPLALVHAIGIGSDTATPWLRSVAVACVIVAVAVVAWRSGARGDLSPAPRATTQLGSSRR